MAQLHLLLDNCPDQPSDYLKTLCRCEQTLYTGVGSSLDCLHLC